MDKAKQPANNIGIHDIVSEKESLLNAIGRKPDTNSVLDVKTASEWLDLAMNCPIPNMLFGEFWFEGELCILFADTNLGKSILAVQIGNSISKGIPIMGLRLDAPAQAVLYCDFELSKKQFENRYSVDYQNHYDFSSNFYRAELNPDAIISKNQKFEQCLYQTLDVKIIETGTKVLIIDNLTYLKDDAEKARDASSIMKELKSLKIKHNLSILVLAHTPKRDPSKPITKNDLSGSKMLINFCDSSFTIGESFQDGSLRYIKQIKQRNTEQIYGDNNVCNCSITKENSFLQFVFIDYGRERDHLRRLTDDESEVSDEQIIEKHNQGLSFREIGQELGVSHMKAKRVVDKQTNNFVTM